MLCDRHHPFDYLHGSCMACIHLPNEETWHAGKCRSSRCRSAEAGKDYGVFIEVDKILVDAHNSVHRVAFNKAFQVFLVKQQSVLTTPKGFLAILSNLLNLVM